MFTPSAFKSGYEALIVDCLNKCGGEKLPTGLKIALT
jgi:hypothetical protein